MTDWMEIFADLERYAIYRRGFFESKGFLVNALTSMVFFLVIKSKSYSVKLPQYLSKFRMLLNFGVKFCRFLKF